MQRINRRAALALAHGNRGRKPVQTISEEVRHQVIQLATTTYAGCNYQHLRDLLAERDGIQLSRTSVRRILLAAGIGSPKKQHRRQHRRRRARYAPSGDVGARSMAVDMPGLGIEAPGSP
jgi:transposase